jgi:hypothetical protein
LAEEMNEALRRFVTRVKSGDTAGPFPEDEMKAAAAALEKEAPEGTDFSFIEAKEHTKGGDAASEAGPGDPVYEAAQERGIHRAEAAAEARKDVLEQKAEAQEERVELAQETGEEQSATVPHLESKTEEEVEAELGEAPSEPAPASAPEEAAPAEEPAEELAEEAGPYDDWSQEDLYAEAQRREIAGRSTMSKDELKAALEASDSE